MADKEAIRPIYSELQGYLSQAPNPEKEYSSSESQLWEQYHSTIDELNEIAGKDYNRFKIRPEMRGEKLRIDISVYRNKLSGLISRLHGEYFSDEAHPFGETPTAVFSQSQQQNQELRVQMVLEVQDIINEKLSKLDDGNKKEKGFLEKVKGGLKSIRTVAQLIGLLLSTAKESGLSIDELKELFM